MMASLPEDRFGDCLLESLRWAVTVADHAAREGALGDDHHLAGKGLQQNVSADEGETETAFVDESRYPIGGPTGLINRDTIEHLVPSKLVYINREQDIDQCDVCMMERALLHYLRDDGVLRQKRRSVRLVLEAERALLRKPIGYDYQLFATFGAMILRLTGNLCALSSRDALQLRVVPCHAPVKRDHWEAACGLLQRFLREESVQGLISVCTANDRNPARMVQDARPADRKSDLVSLGRSTAWRDATTAALAETPPLYGASVIVGQPGTMTDVDLLMPEDGDLWEQLSTLRNNIVTTLAELRR